MEAACQQWQLGGRWAGENTKYLLSCGLEPRHIEKVKFSGGLGSELTFCGVEIVTMSQYQVSA